MVEISEAPVNGRVSDGVYLVKYDEDQWNRYCEETQKFCKDQWFKKASITPAKHVVLMLIPDPLFPSGNHEGPYIEWQREIAQTPVRPWGVDAKVTVTVQPHITKYDLTVLADIERHVRVTFPAGTVWTVFRPLTYGEGQGGETLRTGRV